MINFDDVYNIMKNSFNENEMRDYEGQKCLLKNKKYKIITKYYENSNDVIGFIAFWDLDDFLFVEHLAVDEKMRGHGIGSQILEEFLKMFKIPIILEVEPIHDENSKKRIKFYNNHGFHLLDFYYEQPPLKEGYSFTELTIMSYPDKINKMDFQKYKEKIYKSVYRI